MRQEKGCEALSDVECFAQALKAEVTSDSAKNIIASALKSSQAIDQLSAHIFQASFSPKDSLAKIESRILKSIVDYEVRKLADKKDGLTSECLARIIADFSLIRDYHGGDHRKLVWPLLKRFGKFFLNDDQLQEYTQILASSQKNAQKWLEKTALPMLQPIWYFVVCIWRALQEGENPLSPQDAYWLGVIDEVAGTPLAAHRLAKEAEDTETESIPPKGPPEQPLLK